MNEELISCNLWPVIVWHFEKKAIALWGMIYNDNEDIEEFEGNNLNSPIENLDLFIDKWENIILTKNHYILIFESMDILTQIINPLRQSDNEVNPEYQPFNIKIEGTSFKETEIIYNCEFFLTGKLLKEFEWKIWTHNYVNIVYNDLDLIMDALISIKDKKVFPLYMGVNPEEQSPTLGFLTNELMIYNPDKEDSILHIDGKFESQKVYPLFANAIGRILLKTKIVREARSQNEESI